MLRYIKSGTVQESGWDSGSGAENSSRLWREVRKLIQQRLTWVGYGLIVGGNALIGRLTYMVLTVIEHVVLSLALIIGSYPMFATSQYGLPDTLVKGSLDTLSLHIYPLNTAQFDIDVNTQPLVLHAPSFAIYTVCIVMGIIVTLKLIKAKHFLNAEQMLCLKVLQGWMALHRTLMTYLIAYAITYSSIILTKLNNSSSTDTYAILGCLCAGVLCFTLTFTLSFSLVKVPLILKDLPWNSSSTPTLYLREAFKALLIIQDYYIKSISTSHVVHSGYQAFLLIGWATLCVHQPPRYFDEGVDWLHKLCSRLTLCVAFVCLLRVVLIVELLEYAIYLPLLGYTVIKFFNIWDSRLESRSLRRMIDLKTTSPEDFFTVLHSLSHILDKLKNECNQLTANEEQILEHLHASHRLSCCKENCVCNHALYIGQELIQQCLLKATAAAVPVQLTRLETQMHESDIDISIMQFRRDPTNGSDSMMINLNISPPSNSRLPPISSRRKSSPNPYASSHFGSTRGGTTPPVIREEQKDSQAALLQGMLFARQKTRKAEQLEIIHKKRRCTVFHQGPSTAMDVEDSNSMQIGNIYDDPPLRTQQTGHTNVTSNLDFQNNGYQENVHLEDIFAKEQSSLNRLNQNQANDLIHTTGLMFQRIQMVKGVENYQSKQEFRKALQAMQGKFGFKSQMEARQYYYTLLVGQIIEVFGKETINKEKSSRGSQSDTFLEFRLLYIQYLNSFLNRPFLAIHNLLQINYNHISKVNFTGDVLNGWQRVLFDICEQILIRDVLNVIQLIQHPNQIINNSEGSSSDMPQAPQAQIFSKFIERSNQLKRLDELYDLTARSITDFWRHWQSHAQRDVTRLLSQGRTISRAVSTIKQMQKKIEENVSNQNQLFTDPQRYQLQILFHLSLLHDSQTAQSMHQLQKNCNIPQSKLLMDNREDFSDTNLAEMESHSLSEQAICLVSACSAGEANQLEFLYVNKIFTKLMGLDGKRAQLEGANIKVIMPQTMRENHDAFIRLFFSKGSPKVLGRQRVVFIKDGGGYLRPVRFKLDFSYDQKRFKYAFIGSFEGVQSICLSQEEPRTRLQVKDALILLTDEQLQICDISRNFLQFAGFEGSNEAWNLSQECRGKSFCMDQFLVDLDSFLMQMIHKPEEGQSFKNKIFKFRRYNRTLEDFHPATHNVPVVVTYIQERFAIPHITQPCFLIIPLQKHPEQEMILDLPINEDIAHEFKQSQNNVQRATLMMGQQIIFTRAMKNGFKPNLQFMKTGFPNPRGTQFLEPSSSGSNNNGKDDEEEDTFEMNSQGSSSSQTSTIDEGAIQRNYLFQGKTPKILALCGYIILGLLTAFIVVSIFNLIEFMIKHEEISTRTQSYFYATKRNSNYRLLLLDLQTLHKFSHINTAAGAEKLETYQTALNQHLIDTRTIGSIYDKFTILYDTDMSFHETLEPALFLSIEGKAYYQNMTLRNHYSLFMAYLESLDIQNLKDCPLNYTDYPFRQVKSTETERLLYFIFANGMRHLFELSKRQILQVALTSTNESEDSRLTLNITTYVSVAIVSIIMLSVIPLWAAVQTRHFKLLKFLRYLSKETLQECLAGCSEYQQRLDMIREMQNQNLGEQPPEEDAAAPQQQVDDMNQPIEFSGTLGMTNSRTPGSQNLLKWGSRQSLFQNNKSTMSMYQSRMKSTMKKSKFKKKAEEKKQKLAIEEGKLTLGQIEEQERKKPTQEEEKALELLEQAETRLEDLKNQVKLQKWRAKLQVLILAILCAAFLNSFLLVSQSYSNSVFLNVVDSIENMHIFFGRESCSFDTMLFMREKLIRNSTLGFKRYDTPSTYQQVSGVGALLETCLQTENKISTLLKSFDKVYLNGAKTTIYQMESGSLCNSTFSNITQIQACEKAINGLPLNGLDAVMSFMISYITQTQINFESNPQFRTKKYLEDTLESPRLTEILDLIVFQLRNVFIKVQDAVNDSLQTYIEDSRNYFILIFCVFMFLTIIISLFVGFLAFQRVKCRILETQNIMVIYPTRALMSFQRSELEKYLQS